MAINRGIHYKINRDVVAMGMAVCSLYLVTHYIHISDAKAYATACCDGQYIREYNVITHKRQ